ncbi:Mcm22p LALA0_S02e04016g [Lachancea lanzarotensis]|uniref:LALA0S02e04016g1_1 n=1 Tax=Lachancea lanzarotensis TaxID=1245769 RepID=A0A0C7MMB7_9SACH|nr:uncharacterized protein LALA0_S02e04016g [Lachancea lanzarotensis]CEP60978.1 LALA0S02e04016g1_1 [Lachancea lanzarotensis]
MDTQDELVLYQQSLQREIESKEYFLKQAKAALQLQRNSSDQILKDDIGLWNSFMEKPMFFPDRSDPLGWSLASCELRNRLKSNEQYLELEPLEPLRETLKLQERLNTGLETLEALLKSRLEGHQNAKTKRRSSISAESCNVKLWDILNLLIRNFVAVDLSSKGSDIDQVAATMLDVLKHLLQVDRKVSVEEFSGQCSGLYRILLRANCIRKSKDGRFIELADFFEEF